MIRTKTHSSGKLNEADPHLVKWVLPVFIAAVAGMIASLAGLTTNPFVGLIGVSIFLLLTFMGFAWPAYSARRTMRLAEYMEAHPERYYLLDPANFPDWSLYDLMNEHSDKSGVLHIIKHPVSGHVIDFIEFDDEQDRVMFRLAVP